MTTDEFWKLCVERYPEWGDPEHVVKLKARGLRSLLGQAAAEAVGGKDAIRDASDSGAEMFENLFGTLPRK